ncbi:MAG: MBL fold metallo-hydrolase [Actinomycetales bacterium]
MCVTSTITEAELSRRGLLGLAGASVAAATGATLVSPAAAAAVPKRALHHRHSSRVVLLGVAGGPPPEIDRAGIASALVIGDRVYVIDCGRGAVTQYAQAELAFTNLRGIFVTHLHADHLINFYDFVALPGFGANDSGDGVLPPAQGQQRVQVYGPGRAGGLPPAETPGLGTIGPDNPTPGISDIYAMQMGAFAYSTNLFMRTAGIPDPRELFDVHDIEHPGGLGADWTNRSPDMEPFVIFDDGFVRVSAILVPHGPCYPSYAFRFDSEEGSVVFSGDTAYSENVIRLAQDCDVLVHEVIDVNFYVNFLGVDPALLGHLTRSHTDVTQLGPLAELAGAKNLVLNHLVPADPRLLSDREWRKNARKGYSGRVLVGDDLMSIPFARS